MANTNTLPQDKKSTGYDQEEAWFHEQNRKLIEEQKKKEKEKADSKEC